MYPSSRIVCFYCCYLLFSFDGCIAEPSLYDVCKFISGKVAVTPFSEGKGVEQERAINSLMRLRGREMNVSPILVDQTVKYDKAKQWVGLALFNVILRGDDGTLRRSIIDQLQKNSGRRGVYDLAVILDMLSKQKVN